MEISCPECQRRFFISDDKLPANTKTVFTCPGCKGKIPVDTTKQGETISSWRDTIQEGTIEFFEEGAQKGLVCLPEEPIREDVARILRELDYKTSIAGDRRTFYAKVRYNQYDVIITSERFAEGGLENNPVLKYLEHLPMSVRRNISLVLISHYGTFDALMAFSLSVDTVINENDLGNIREILHKSRSQHEQFYRVFKQCLVAEGRA